MRLSCCEDSRIGAGSCRAWGWAVRLPGSVWGACLGQRVEKQASAQGCCNSTSTQWVQSFSINRLSKVTSPVLGTLLIWT